MTDDALNSLHFHGGRPTRDLLRLGLRPERPIEALVERLEQDDGTSWLVEAIASHGLTLTHDHVLSGAALSELEALKESAKRRNSVQATLETQHQALAGYFLAAAAALAHHRTRISSATPAELHEAFLELAAVAPPAWRDLLTTALRHLAADDDSDDDTGVRPGTRPVPHHP